MINEALSTSLLHRVYKLARYQTVADDLQGTWPTSVLPASAVNADSDRSMELAFSQVGQSSATVTVILCDAVKIKLLQMVETHTVISIDHNLPSTKARVIATLIYSVISFVDR